MGTARATGARSLTNHASGSRTFDALRRYPSLRPCQRHLMSSGCGGGRDDVNLYGTVGSTLRARSCRREVASALRNPCKAVPIGSNAGVPTQLKVEFRGQSHPRWREHPQRYIRNEGHISGGRQQRRVDGQDPAAAVLAWPHIDNPTPPPDLVNDPVLCHDLHLVRACHKRVNLR